MVKFSTARFRKGGKNTNEGVAQSAARHADDVIQEKPKRTYASYVWDTLGKSPEERRFLFKLDSALLTFACLGYFIKYLDQVKYPPPFILGAGD